MKKEYVKRRAIVVIEVLLAIGLLAFLSQYLRPIEDSWGLIERLVFCYIGYQVVVFLVNKIRTEVRKDSLLAYINLLKLAELYFEQDLRMMKPLLELQISSLAKEPAMLKRYKNTLRVVGTLLDVDGFPDEAKVLLKTGIIYAEHELSEMGLIWNYTLLLNWMMHRAVEKNSVDSAKAYEISRDMFKKGS